jgi:hypothetical protein
VHQFQIKGGCRADALDRLQLLEGGPKHGRQAAEAGQEVFCDRLDLTTRQAAGQEEFEKLVVRQSLEADRRPGAQPLAMAGVVRLAGRRDTHRPPRAPCGREERAGQFGQLLARGHGLVLCSFHQNKLRTNGEDFQMNFCRRGGGRMDGRPPASSGATANAQ